MEANETRYSNPDQQRQKKGSDDPPNNPNQDINYEARRTYRNVGTQDNRTVLFPVRMGSTTTTKIDVERRFPNRPRPGDKVVSYTNSEKRDLNSNAICPDNPVDLNKDNSIITQERQT
jgi:hypothetical protein